VIADGIETLRPRTRIRPVVRNVCEVIADAQEKAYDKRLTAAR
jgi:hypothetical protein